jgi:imidazolonepropionase-like amidohydrolase
MPIGENTPPRLVLTGVTIVDTHDGRKTGGMTIAIENGKIATIGQGAPAGGAATTIDARGKFVVPGYLDMHAHPLGSRDDEGSLNTMLAYGITGVRQMSGSPDMLTARREGRLIPTEAAPELVAMPGMILMPLNAGSPEAAAAEIRKQKEAGADFIKIVMVPSPTFFAALEEAKRVGLPFAGHIPRGVDVTEAARNGMFAIEHLHGSFEASSSDPAALRNADGGGAPRLPPLPEGFTLNEVFERAIANPILIRPPSYEFERLLVAAYSADKAKRLAEQFVAAGTWQVPTLIRRRTMQLGDDPLYRNDPNLRFIPGVTRQMWESLAQQFSARVGTASKKILADLAVLQFGLIKIFRDAGVNMVAGSDMGGQWCIPGVSLHQEFELLGEAGLTPLEILQMTTLNGAKFLSRETTMGTVEAGKNADLVLLDVDPLAGVQNLNAIHGVVRAGKYYSASALGDLKKKTEQRHAAAA